MNQIEPLTEVVNGAGKNDPIAKLLMSVPGIGAIGIAGVSMERDRSWTLHKRPGHLLRNKGGIASSPVIDDDIWPDPMINRFSCKLHCVTHH